jgi:hypothetical protein
MQAIHEALTESADAIINRFRSGALGGPQYLIWSGEPEGLQITLVLTEEQRVAISSVASPEQAEVVEFLMISVARTARGALADRLGLPPGQVFDGDIGRLALDVGLWFDYDGKEIKWQIPPEHLDELAALLTGKKSRVQK